MAKRGTIDINEGFGFIFKDKRWVNKAGIGALLTLTIIGIPAVYGWALEVQRQVIKTGKAELPEWDNTGEFFASGFKYWLVQIFINLPFYVVFCSSFLLMSEPAREEWLTSASFFLFQIVSILWSVLLYLSLPILSGAFVETKSILAALNVTNFIKTFRANWGQFLGVAFLSYVASYAAGLAGMAMLCIGILFTTPLALVVTHHLFGQAYRNAKARLK